MVPSECHNSPPPGRLIALLGLAFLLLAVGERPAAGAASSVAEQEPSPTSLTLRASPLPGVVDLYLGGKLIHNLVPVVTWQDADGQHYNNAEIQRATVQLTPLADGYLLEYERFTAVEHVAGAPEQPPSQIQLTLRVEREGPRLLVSPAAIDNPANLSIQLGVGHFYGMAHGTQSIELESGAGRWSFEPATRKRLAEPEAVGRWHALAGVETARLVSSRAEMPALLLQVTRGSGRVDIEVRDQPWSRQMTVPPDLGVWIEAVIFYADPSQFPLYLSASN